MSGDAGQVRQVAEQIEREAEAFGRETGFQGIRTTIGA